MQIRLSSRKSELYLSLSKKFKLLIKLSQTMSAASSILFLRLYFLTSNVQSFSSRNSKHDNTQSHHGKQGSSTSLDYLVEPCLLLHQKYLFLTCFHFSDGDDADGSIEGNSLVHELCFELQNLRLFQRPGSYHNQRNLHVLTRSHHQLSYASCGTFSCIQIQFFTYAKKYNSYTKYEGSFTLYYSIFYVINSCCVVYLVHENNLQDTK